MTRKIWLVGAATLLAMPLSIGAIGALSPEQDRPVVIDATDWIRISESAGVAIIDQPRGDEVVGRLYIKRGSNWLAVSVQNSPQLLK